MYNISFVGVLNNLERRTASNRDEVRLALHMGPFLYNMVHTPDSPPINEANPKHVNDDTEAIHTIPIYIGIQQPTSAQGTNTGKRRTKL